jgi:hypothetical protein
LHCTPAMANGTKVLHPELALLGLLCACTTSGDGRDADALCLSGACAPWPGDGADDADDGEGSGTDASDGADDGGQSGDPSGVDAGLPCDVRDALVQHCGMCHADPPAFGAPMALMTHDDLHVPSPGDLARPVYEVIAERLVADTGRMPPGGDIDDASLERLLGFMEGGAPLQLGAGCGDAPDGDAHDDDVGPDALPCDAPQVLTAHAAGSDTPFHVPAQGADDLYQCFAFASPFAAGAQATAWAPIIDDERVIHHFILYRTSEPQPDGGTFPCDSSLQLTADFVAGWAPGGGNAVLPADVGLELGGPGEFYVLQVHYHNAAHHGDALDRSGVAFCVADTPRPQTAGVLTVGTVGLDIPAGATAHAESGTCGWLSTSFWPEPMHVIGSSPHMHELGRSFHTEVQHGDGSIEVITDVPAFSFDSQAMYWLDPEVVVAPGDTIRTTCVYDNPNGWNVGFGEGTGDEMCFDFLLAWPIQSLDNRNCGIIF